MAESKKKRSSSSRASNRPARTPRATNTAPATPSRTKKDETPKITHRTSSGPSSASSRLIPSQLPKVGFDSNAIISSVKTRLSQKRVWIWVGSIALTLLVVLMAWWQWQRSYIAVVNGQYIHTTVLEDQLVANSGAQTIDTLIQQQLIMQDSHNKGVTVSEDKIQAELDTFKESTGGNEAFQSSLLEYGISEELLRNQIKVRLTLEELLAEEIAVSEDELREYYDQNKEEVDVADEGFDAARERIEMQLKEQRLSQASSQYIEGLQQTSSISRNIDHATLTFGRFLQEDVLSIPSDVWNLFASLAPSE